MEIQEILTTLATYVGPSIIAGITIYLQYKKNKGEVEALKAEAEKTKKEGDSTEGGVYLAWTKEFKDRLKAVEDREHAHAELIDEQSKRIFEQNNRLDSQDKLIRDQAILLVEANARIVLLEKENVDLRQTVVDLENKNTVLNKRIFELEQENLKLKGC